MKKIGIFMADGCEEIEGLTVVDVLRRAGVEIQMISINGKKQVEGSHKITFLTDMDVSEMNPEEFDGVVLPGGLPGTYNLRDDERVQKIIGEFKEEGKLIAAICAAPSVFGEAGLLEGKKATFHPGFEDKLLGAEWMEEPVVVDGNVITSRAMGTATNFALEILAYGKGKEAAQEMRKSLLYKG